MSDIEFDNEHPKNVMEWQRENSPFTNLVFVQSSIFKSPYFNKKKPVMEEFGNNFQSPVGGSHVAGKKGKKGKKGINSRKRNDVVRSHRFGNNSQVIRPQILISFHLNVDHDADLESISDFPGAVHFVWFF